MCDGVGPWGCTVETPQNVGSGLLLGQEVLKNTIDVFPVSNWAKESSEQAFLKKYLNIIDPLKQNNNVGRSVSKGTLPYLPFERLKRSLTVY